MSENPHSSRRHHTESRSNSSKINSNSRHHTESRSNSSKTKSNSRTQKIGEYDESEIYRNENYEIYDTTSEDYRTTVEPYSVSPLTPYNTPPDYSERTRGVTQDRTVYQDPSMNYEDQSYNNSVHSAGYETRNHTTNSHAHWRRTAGTIHDYKVKHKNPSPFEDPYKEVVTRPQVNGVPTPVTHSWYCAGPVPHWNENNFPNKGRYKCFECPWAKRT